MKKRKMKKFRDIEKENLQKFKKESNSISKRGREDGLFMTKYRPFCFPRDSATENLYPAIRESAVQFFDRNEIKWHNGQAGNPSNHMCDSQVCCVNFLFPFGDQPKVLAKMLKPFYPELAQMLPIEEGRYVTFEWIGTRDYLNEKAESRNKIRSRGANCTSADAAIMFEEKGGRKHLLLIEWKFTEYYSTHSYATSKGGETRLKTYQDFFNRGDVLRNEEYKISYESLFFEPFYQFMRQQFLAHEMEKHHELEADIVSVLHIAPQANHDFYRITSPNLIGLGETATDVWGRLVKNPEKFKSVYTEELFGKVNFDHNAELDNWYDYVCNRYRWLKNPQSDLS